MVEEIEMTFEDAVEYACGGCMEVGIQGMTSDFLYIGWQNTAKMLELMVTGGICLRTGKKVNAFKYYTAYGLICQGLTKSLYIFCKNIYFFIFFYIIHIL